MQHIFNVAVMVATVLTLATFIHGLPVEEIGGVCSGTAFRLLQLSVILALRDGEREISFNLNQNGRFGS